MRHQYNLGFISDEDIFNHVKNTVMQYRTKINLAQFNANVVDPIKLTFDSKVYGVSLERMIENECVRQIDKSNNNTIGYFHQNLFKYAGHGWTVPVNGVTGFDVENAEKHIYVEMKNKHNTMNSSSAQRTFSKMTYQLIEDGDAVCMLVEVIAKQSQNIVWQGVIDGKKFNNHRIRRVSIDKFYSIVFDDDKAFMKLCQVLPTIIDDVIAEQKQEEESNTIFKELYQLSPNILRSLYLLAFKTYDGFDQF